MGPMTTLTARESEKVWFSRYIVTLCDPLISSGSRIEVEQQVTAIAARSPHRLAVWSAGFLADVVRSLDPNDPWRKLTASVDGALHPDKTPFGSYADATDLLPRNADDLRSDLGLAALEKRLGAESAALIAIANRGWSPTYRWMSTHLIDDGTLRFTRATRFSSAVDIALRWAIHRRRIFVGSDDPFVPVCGVLWLTRASRIMAGLDWDEALAARALQQAAIPTGTYAQFACL